MPTERAVILAGSIPCEADKHMARLLGLLGVPCQIVVMDEGAPLELGEGLKPSECGLILSAGNVGKLLHHPTIDRLRVRGFVQSFCSSLIYGVQPSSLPPEDLNFLTRNSDAKYGKLKADDRFTVSDKHRDHCGPLSGMHIKRRADSAPYGIQIDPTAGNVDTLIAVGDKAALVRLSGETSRMFLSTSGQVLNLEEQVSANFDGAAIFAELVPHVMYARSAFPEACWKPKQYQACLVIDDPPLHRRYGFLNLVELLQVLAESRFAANLAFIPWNFSRSRMAVVNMIRSSDALALCIHGCDHTRAEFGGHDEAWQNTLVQLALERMDQHQEQTGIVHQKIMVFPQGVFSKPAMRILKSRNFTAAVNTEVVPHHNMPERGKIALGELLDVAISTYDNFPLFSRRNCHGPLLDCALDLFMGKPCLLVAHHDYFQSGFSPMKKLVSALNEMVPDLKWMTLGDVLNESYRWRKFPGGATAICMFANQATLENKEEYPAEFEVMKPECDGSAVDSVLLDGTAIAFAWGEGHVRFSCLLGPGQKAGVRVNYKEPVRSEHRAPGFRYRVQSAARRYMSEIRDDYLQPLRHRLSGANR